MTFPDWVDAPGLTDLERAGNRLRYLFLNIALQRSERPTLRAFAILSGIEPATINNCISRGYCSAAMAIRIEDTFGRDTAPNEHFRKPLEIDAE